MTRTGDNASDGQVASRGVLAITDLTPRSAPRAMVAPAAVPTPVPLAAPVQSASTRPRHRNAAAVLPPRLLARVQQVVTGYYIASFPRITAAETRRQQVGRSSDTVPPADDGRDAGDQSSADLASSATWRWPIHRPRRLRPYRPPPGPGATVCHRPALCTAVTATMRRHKPRVAMRDEVTITRQEDTAVIAFHDGVTPTTNLVLGEKISGLSDHAILDLYNQSVRGMQACAANYRHVAREVPARSPRICPLTRWPPPTTYIYRTPPPLSATRPTKAPSPMRTPIPNPHRSA